MSDVAHETSQEFWRPPSPLVAQTVVEQPALPIMSEACSRCGTEFLLGSHFCHTCGGRRQTTISASARSDAAEIAGLWEQAVAKAHNAVSGFSPVSVWRRIEFPSWLRYLHFHEIQRWIGLPTASMIAFVIGICCVSGALLVGLITARTFVEWQAVQFYRAEWLLAATAAFVAGILLKKPSGGDPE
jgi:hypothetical protein